MPSALITGITGQDGSYLAELLLGKGYAVHGLVRSRTKAEAAPNLRWIRDRLQLHEAALTDSAALVRLVREIIPSEIYHLAGQTHVGTSFANAEGTLRDNVLGTSNVITACQQAKPSPRLFFASTSQVFGHPAAAPQNEQCPFRPISPYGASKACATDLVRIARETDGLFAVSGILYNHESPRRGPEFVTGKICQAAAAIRQGRGQTLKLGDTSALRDWGDAREFVAGFWRALQAEQPSDYIFATGRLHTVQNVVETAFSAVDLDWQAHVEIDPQLFRPAEPTRLVGDPSRARDQLGWQARKSFAELITEMTQTHLRPANE